MVSSAGGVNTEQASSKSPDTHMPLFTAGALGIACQFRDTSGQFRETLTGRFVDERDRWSEHVPRHQHLQGSSEVLAVVVAEQWVDPRGELRDATARHGRGHGADCFDLVGHRDALSDYTKQVRVFLGQVSVEMEL